MMKKSLLNGPAHMVVQCFALWSVRIMKRLTTIAANGKVGWFHISVQKTNAR